MDHTGSVAESGPEKDVKEAKTGFEIGDVSFQCGRRVKVGC